MGPAPRCGNLVHKFYGRIGFFGDEWGAKSCEHMSGCEKGGSFMMEEFRPEGGHNDAWWGFKKTNTKYTAVGDANEGDVSRRTRAERDGTFTDERGRRSSCVRPSPIAKDRCIFVTKGMSVVRRNDKQTAAGHLRPIAGTPRVFLPCPEEITT